MLRFTPGVALVPSPLVSAPCACSVAPGAATPIDANPLPSALPNALQLTPLCDSLPSTISTILASSITWRSIEICTAFR